MSASRTSSVQLRLESLESRNLMTTAVFSGGTLAIVGTAYADRIEVLQSNGNLSVSGIMIDRVVGNTFQRVSTIAARDISLIDVQAPAGNDVVQMRTATVQARISGGLDNDFIVGTQANDLIGGGQGNDTVFGMAGNDNLNGAEGSDCLYGMDGLDGLFGGNGADFLDDGNRSGQEYCDGGNGMDWNADVIDVNGTGMADVRQRGAPDCSFLSTLAGLANRGYNFRQWIKYVGFTPEGVPQYDVAFYTNTGWTWTRLNFTNQLTSNDPAPAVEGESWVVIMQRAWQQFRASRGFSADGNAWPHEAIYALTGRTAAAQYVVRDADFDRIASAVRNGDLVNAATPYSTLSTSSLVGGHAYTVLDAWGSGSNRWILLRNPWGFDGGTGYGDPNDALVWVTWRDFQVSMNYLAITDL